MKCKNCGFENFDEALFCVNCGAKTGKQDDVVICPVCGAKNESDSVFCSECGIKFTPRSQAPVYDFYEDETYAGDDWQIDETTGRTTGRQTRKTRRDDGSGNGGVIIVCIAAALAMALLVTVGILVIPRILKNRTTGSGRTQDQMNTAETTPAPAVTSAPAVVVTPAPAPAVTPEPAPAVTPEPAPAVTPVPAPAATPEPAPVVTPEPAPVVTPEPAPAATPAPQQNVYDLSNFENRTVCNLPEGTCLQMQDGPDGAFLSPMYWNGDTIFVNRSYVENGYLLAYINGIYGFVDSKYVSS